MTLKLHICSFYQDISCHKRAREFISWFSKCRYLNCMKNARSTVCPRAVFVTHPCMILSSYLRVYVESWILPNCVLWNQVQRTKKLRSYMNIIRNIFGYRNIRHKSVERIEGNLIKRSFLNYRTPADIAPQIQTDTQNMLKLNTLSCRWPKGIIPLRPLHVQQR
jgi:hypothetical protein